MSSPIIPFLIAFMAGICCSYLFPVVDTILHIVLMAALVVLFFSVKYTWKRGYDSLLIFTVFILGLLAMGLYSNPLLTKIISVILSTQKKWLSKAWYAKIHKLCRKKQN